MTYNLSENAADELAMIREWDARTRAADQRARTWTGTGLHYLNQYARQHQFIEPGAMLSLARSEVDPASPAALQAARVAGIDYFQGWRQGREPGESDPTAVGAPFRLLRDTVAHVQAATAQVAATVDSTGAIMEQYAPAFELTPLELVALGGVSINQFTGEGPTVEERVRNFDPFGREGGVPSFEEAVEQHNLIVQARQQLRANGFGERVDTEVEQRRQAFFDERNATTSRLDQLEVLLPEDEAAGRMGGPLVNAILNGKPIDVDVEELRAELAERDVVQTPGGLPEGSTAAAVVRPVFAILNAPLQEAMGAFRRTVGNVREHGWDSVLNPLNTEAGLNLRSESDAGIAAERLLRGQEVDMGTSALPGGAIARERVRREISHGLVRGEPFTPGRWAADLVYGGSDPNATGFDILSGVVDFAVTARLDPTDIAFAARRNLTRFAGEFTGPGTMPGAIPTTGSVVDEIAPVSEVPAIGAPAADVAPTTTREALLTEAGGFGNHPIPDLDRSTVAGFLHSPRGNRIVQHIAQQGDFATLDAATGHRLPPEVALRLADEADPDAVRSILFDTLQLHGDQSFNYRAPLMLRSTWGRRAAGTLPEVRMDLTDPRRFVNQVRDYMVNARAPEEMIATRLRHAALMQTEVGRIGVQEAMLDDVASLLEARGIDPVVAREVTGWVGNHSRHGTLYNVDGDVNRLPGTPDATPLIADKAWKPQAHIYSEVAPNTVTLPNIREIKRMTSVIQKLGPMLIDQRTGKFHKGGAPINWAADFMGMWKKIVMLRPAYIVRQVLGDEQVRLAISNNPGILRHPVQLLASVLTDGKFLDDLLAAADEPNGMARVLRERSRVVMSTQANEAVTHRVALDEWGEVVRGEEHYVEAWGRELGQLHGDPIARRLAAGESQDEVVDALMSGDLARTRAEWITVRPHLDNIDGVRWQVRTTWDRLQLKAGATPERAASQEILEAVANGGFRGVDGRRLFFWEPGRNAPTDGFHDVLNGYVDNFGPDGVKGEKSLTGARERDGRVDRTFQMFFSGAVARTSNRLARSPAYRQSFFEIMADKIPHMNPEAQARALALAEKWADQMVTIGDVAGGVAGATMRAGAALVPIPGVRAAARKTAKKAAKKVVARVESDGPGLAANRELLDRIRSRAALGSGDVAWNDAYGFMTHLAAERTLDIVGDFLTKGQTTDALRIVSPFGNAWRESLSTYAKLLAKNPTVPYDVMKGYKAATDSGLFYTDDNGEMVFAYPMSAQLAQAIPGWVPGVGDAPAFPLTGRVQGLTMGFEVMPSVGPVIQIPVKALLSDAPSLNWARNILIPYGAESNQTLLVPEWLEKIGVALTATDNPVLQDIGSALSGAEGAAQFEMSLRDVMTYLYSENREKYDAMSPNARMDALRHDAHESAMGMWLIRGLAQAVAPAAPRPLPVFRLPGAGDDTGLFDPTDSDTILIGAMVDRFYALRDRHPTDYGIRFVTEFGEAAMYLMEAKSESNALYLPGDRVGDEWIRNHPGEMERYPDLAGLFAPMGDEQAGIGSFFRSIEEGLRDVRDLEDIQYAAQDRLASLLYREARLAALQVALDAGYSSIQPEHAQALRDYRRTLMLEYPGFQREGTNIPDITRTVVDLREALGAEHAFRETEAGEALTAYLDARDAALDHLTQAREAGIIPGDSLTSDAAEPVRLALLEYGERLVASHPSFINVWERVLEGEIAFSQSELLEIEAERGD